MNSFAARCDCSALQNFEIETTKFADQHNGWNLKWMVVRPLALLVDFCFAQQTYRPGGHFEEIEIFLEIRFMWWHL